MNAGDILIRYGTSLIIFFLLGIIIFIIYGYLWNYYIIQELRRTNTRLIELRETLGDTGVKLQNSSQMNMMPQSDIMPQDEDKRLNEMLKREYESLRIKEENRRLQEEINRLKNS
jgi:hypothetical protein